MSKFDDSDATGVRVPVGKTGLMWWPFSKFAAPSSFGNKKMSPIGHNFWCFSESPRDAEEFFLNFNADFQQTSPIYKRLVFTTGRLYTYSNLLQVMSFMYTDESRALNQSGNSSCPNLSHKLMWNAGTFKNSLIWNTLGKSPKWLCISHTIHKICSKIEEISAVMPFSTVMMTK
jgi:hypothetical protein